MAGSSPRGPSAGRLAAVAFAFLTASPAFAAAPPRPPAVDVTLACVHEAGDAAACGPAQPGIVAWLGEVRRRTSVAVNPAPRPVAWRDGPPAEPLVLWTGSVRPQPLDVAERRSLRQFLQAGGTLWVDAEDGRHDGPFVDAVRQELAAAFGAEAVGPLHPRHVLYRSFYLATPPHGRAAAPTTPDAVRVGGRVAAVLLQHDLFGALAARAQEPETVTAGLEDGRRSEMDLRFAINWLMYALCGDYKDDHVHLPYILKRRG